MTLKSASSYYAGYIIETKGVLNKLKNLYQGGYYIKLNLMDFIEYFNLDMILNNELIGNENLYFELYNREELIKDDIDIIKLEIEEELKEFKENNEIRYYLKDLIDYYGLDKDLNNIDNDNLSEAIYEYCDDHIYEHNEAYQFFIIPENQLYYWLKYTKYPIYKECDSNLYLVGITHWGMSWKFFETDYIKFIPL